MLYKLRAIALPTTLFNVIKSYPEEGVFNIQVGDTRSPLIPLKGEGHKDLFYHPYSLHFMHVPQPDDLTRGLLYMQMTRNLLLPKSPALLRMHFQYHLVTLAKWCRVKTHYY
jgi:hypothetical protein